MSLSIQQIEILMHYRFGVGDVSGAFTNPSRCADVSIFVADGVLEKNTLDQNGSTVRLSGKQLRLSDKGYELIEKIFSSSSYLKGVTSQEVIDKDFERWIREKHNPGRNLVWPLKEVFKTEYVAYCQGRKDEQL
jgi:hypothetical protein